MTVEATLLQEIRDELRGLRATGGAGIPGDIGKFSAALKSLQSAAMGTADSLLKFSNTAATGQVGFQDVLGTFSNLAGKIPILGGTISLLTQAMTVAVGITEKNVEVYKNISSSGANFGGSLVQLRQAAMNTYMTMDEFAGLMKNNNQTFSKMGGSVDEGARAFVNVATTLQKSPMGDNLRALGFTSQELNQGLIDYIALTGGRTRKEMQNTDALTKGATQYLEQLDGLAKLTGESREQLAAKMKEESANAAWESYLLTLDEKGREKANAARLEAEARGGKGAAQALQAKLMGLPPMTEAAQRFVGTMASGNEALDGLAAGVTDTSKSVDDVKKSGSAFSVGLAKDGQNLKQVGSALIMAGKDTGEFAKAIGAANQAQRNQVTTVEEQVALEKRIAEEGKKQKQSEAASIIRFQTLLQETGNRILNFLMPAFTFLTNALVNVTTYLIKFLEPLVEIGKNFITKTIIPIFEKFKEPFMNFSTGFIKNTLLPFFKGIFDTIKNFDFTPLVNFFKNLYEAVMGIDWKGIFEAAKQVFIRIVNFIKELWASASEIFGPTITKIGEVFTKIGNELGPVFKDLGDIAKVLFEHISAIMDWMKPFAIGFYNGIMKVAKPIIDMFVDNFYLLWGVLGNFIKALKALLTGDFATMGDQIKEMFSKIWQGIKNGLSALWESIKSAFNPLTWGKSKEEAPATPATPTAAPTVATPASTPASGTPAKPGATPAAAPAPATPASAAPAPTPPVTQEEKRTTAQERLNNVNEQILATLKAIEDHHRRTLDAIRKLNPNQF